MTDDKLFDRIQREKAGRCLDRRQGVKIEGKKSS
jgi:hypothetical protein